MNDEYKPEDDDFLDDDFDLDDFDDDDTLGDESWDDLDDGIADESQNSAPAHKKQKSASAGGKKSFISKHFNIIVIGVAVVIGGGVMLSVLGGGDSSQQQSGAYSDLAETQDLSFSDTTELAGQDALPPMPTPMHPVQEEAGAPSVLTPIPENLDVASSELPPLPTLGDDNELSGDFGFDLDNDPAPDLVAEAPLPTIEVERPPVKLPGKDQAFEDLKLPEADVAETPAPAQIAAAEFSAPEIATPPVTSVPAAAPAAAPAATIDMSEVDGRIAGLDKSLTTRISDTDKKIERLANAIEALEKQVSQLATQQAANAAAVEKAQAAATAAAKTAATPAPATPTPTAPAAETPKAKAPEATTKPAAKPAAKPAPTRKAPVLSSTPSSAAAPKWVLRSAQPGSAILSAAGSNDMRTVEVGSSLKGIGRVTSIALENGKWVVRGTQGSVLQP